MASLEEAGFHLPRCAQVEARGGNPNADNIPISKHDNKTVHRVPRGKEHNNNWLFGKNLTTIILRVKNVLNLGYGHVYSLEFHGGVKVVTYEVTIGVITNCIRLDFVSMLTSLKKRGKSIPCKHMYFIYKVKMFCDHNIDDFINQPTLSINKVKKRLQ